MDKNYKQKVLEGKVIICTFPNNGDDEFSEIMHEAGAEIYAMPMICIKSIPFVMPHETNYYDWLVFTSKNAVGPFSKSLKEKGRYRVAAIGQSTANKIEQAGVQVHFTGSGKSGESFAEELLTVIREGSKILFVSGTKAPDKLQQILNKKYITDRVNVYGTEISPSVDSNIIQRINNDQYDLVVVTSPSGIEHLMPYFSQNREKLRLASIGQTTTSAIRRFNIEPVLTAAESSYKGLAKTIIDYFIS